MPRMKLKNVKHLPPVTLDMDDPYQKELWDNYQKQTKRGNGQQYLRDTLILGIRPYDSKKTELVYEDVD